MNFHRLREFREFGDPTNAASVGLKLSRKLHGIAMARSQKLLGLGSVVSLVVGWAYFAFSTKYHDFAIVSAMNEDYLPMAIGIIVAFGLIAVAGFIACKLTTGDEPPPPIAQMIPGPAGDSIVQENTKSSI